MFNLITLKDATILVKSDRSDDYRDVMNRNAVLKMFFMGHTACACEKNNCAPHKHMSCFIELIHDISHRNTEKLDEIFEFFNNFSGTLAEKYKETRIKFQSNTPSIPELPEIVKDMLDTLSKNTNGHEQIRVMLMNDEIIVMGENQPTDKELFELLHNSIDMKRYDIKKMKIRRLDNDGNPIQSRLPKLATVDLDGHEDKISIVADESFSDLLQRIKKN